MGKHLTTIQRDRKNALLDKLDNEVYKKTILGIEAKIETLDKEVKELDKQIHDHKHHNEGDLRNKRIRRRKLHKERKQLKINLDLLQK